MERLLVVKLDAVDCDAEAWLNGVPVARADAARPRAVVPVHEYTLAGVNRLQLVLWPSLLPPAPISSDAKPPPPPEPRLADGRQSASLRVLLPRVGQPADEASARTLGQLDWAPQAGTAYDAPLTLSDDITLPVSFPRWRWLDAPPSQPTEPLLRERGFAFVQQLAQSLADGDVEPFTTATRLRTEELAAAYQRHAGDEAARLRAHLKALHAEQRLRWLPMDAAGFTLRSLAGGRLLDCLDATGAPVLRSAPDAAGRSVALPLRVAVVENRFYVLR